MGLSSCSVCSAGSYGVSYGAISCMPCLPGTYSTTAGATSATVCIPCPVGTWSDLAGQIPVLHVTTVLQEQSPQTNSLEQVAVMYANRVRQGNTIHKEDVKIVHQVHTQHLLE